MSRKGDLKSEVISRAYRELRISGLTKNPSGRELEHALDTLENMAEEYKERGICTGYNFEDEPDPSSPHNLKRKYWDSYSLGLARRLISTFGKGAMDKIDPELLKRQRAAFSFLSSSTAQVRNVLPPSRMPVGSGSRRYRRGFSNFNPIIEQSPISCSTNKMIIGEVDNYTEHFDAYLNDGETISSYVLEADTGLTINSESNTTTDVLYSVTATGTNENTTYNALQVKITVTTTDSRVSIRVIDFELSGA